MSVKKRLAFWGALVMMLSLAEIGFAAPKYQKAEALDLQRQKEIFEAIEVQPLAAYEPRYPIVGFDIRQDGSILLGVQGSGNTGQNEIYIFNPQGQYEYGFAFQCAGLYFVRWNGENAQLYFVRGETLVELDREGNRVDVQNLSFARWNAIEPQLHRSRIKKNGYTYVIEKANGVAGCLEYYYARMARLGPEGTREVIYDVGQAFETRANTIFVMIMCGIGGEIAYAIHYVIDKRRRYRVYED